MYSWQIHRISTGSITHGPVYTTDSGDMSKREAHPASVVTCTPLHSTSAGLVTLFKGIASIVEEIQSYNIE